MARKEAADTPQRRGFDDILGIVLLASAFLLFAALFSFDRYDLSANRVPPNESPHNWIGPIGAHTAYSLFFLFGAGAFVAPFLLLIFGLSCFFPVFAYLRNRWIWALTLFISCIGVLDLYSEELNLELNETSGWAGGLLGALMNDYVFNHFGRVGATTIFTSIYLISLLYMTNFELGRWVRNTWERGRALFQSRAANPEERELERRKRELEREARRLEREVGERSPEPVDEPAAPLQPYPEPTVRDHSISQPRSRSRQKTEPPSEPDPEPNPFAGPVSASPKPATPGPSTTELEEGEVISARELSAASTIDVLGEAASENSEANDKDSAAADGAQPAGSETPLPRLPRVTITKPSKPKKRPISVSMGPKIGDYRLPDVDLLNYPEGNLKPTDTKEELMANARLMQATLAQFGIEVTLGDITKGPTITRYELHPAPGVKLEKITGLTNNIAAALRAERINILAPVPGKSSVGVEVPNRVKTKVIMRDLMESDEWQKTRARIPLALGKDVYGQPIIADLAEMPHLLIAGSTGSGKSVCINSIIASLLLKFSPDELRFVMIDPKVVELQQYNSLPHLVVPVVNDPKKVILALRWVVNEMEKRYQIFAKVGVRNIKSFNDRPKSKPAPPPSAQQELPLTAKKEKVEAASDGFAVELDEEIVVPRDDDILIPDRLSYIVVIIDELADLMLVAPADVEMAIARITQMARAAGIHCIVATQRPSVDVITGVIKANIPARIAFQVAAKVDSRTILDAMGADKLLGKGDMLYLPPGSAKLIRAQGALITDQEIQDVVDFIAKQGQPSYDMDIHKQLSKPVTSHDEDRSSGEDEDLIEQCIEIIRTEQKASVSLIQRRLRLGYTRAARIMDELEDRGIVGPSKGAEPRDILIDLDGGGMDGGGNHLR